MYKLYMKAYDDDDERHHHIDLETFKSSIGFNMFWWIIILEE